MIAPYRIGIDLDRTAVRRYLRFVWPIFAATGALVLIQQGQLIAFQVYDGIVAVGFITFAYTLTRFADRADQIVTQTIYPAICAVRERTRTLEELFEKSNRLTLIWVFPFAALFVLFAEDLVDIVLGSKWEPSIVLLQGLGVAAALQQLGFNWYSFYRARGNPGPQAVEAAFVVGGFLLLAVPALFAWGFEGFVAGRIAGGLIVVVVRRVYVRRLLPGARFMYTAFRALVPVLFGAIAALALRSALWGGERTTAQAVGELALFLAATALATWVARAQPAQRTTRLHAPRHRRHAASHARRRADRSCGRSLRRHPSLAEPRRREFGQARCAAGARDECNSAGHDRCAEERDEERREAGACELRRRALRARLARLGRRAARARA